MISPPTAGDRWTLSGSSDIVITAVSGKWVTYTYGSMTDRIEISEYLTLAAASLRRGATLTTAAQAAILANLENIDPDDDI